LSREDARLLEEVRREEDAANGPAGA